MSVIGATEATTWIFPLSAPPGFAEQPAATIATVIATAIAISLVRIGSSRRRVAGRASGAS